VTRAFRLLNVFARPGEPFSGNPLAVIEDDGGLDTETCQALARQFNLSETTVVSPGEPGTDARVRIFTPTIELGFAGHPTLGTAAVVAGRAGLDHVVLGMRAGPIPVRFDEGRWTLTANPAQVTTAALEVGDLAAMLGVHPEEVAGPAVWADSGLRQLLVELRTGDAVRRARPDAPLLRRLAMTDSGEALVYAWAWTGPDTVEARLFFSEHTAVVEDPATGSACANLGGLWAHEGRRGLRVVVSQGAAVDRPSLLHVEVDTDAVVRVGGLVREVGRGLISVGA